MAPPKSLIQSAAMPKYGDHFDAWNSSATGHQMAENRLSKSTGWRQSRSIKLSCQLKNRATGGKRISGSTEAGSENSNKMSDLGSGGVRAKTRVTVADMLVPKENLITLQKKLSRVPTKLAEEKIAENASDELITSERRIFHGLNIYINGSTAPFISDHKLKCLLAEHGAKISMHLSRRQITHVVLGNPCGRVGGMGAGGGLSAIKIQKEIKRKGGSRIKYIGVEWVLESLKAGIRLPEARFQNLTASSKGQRSVYSDAFKAESVISYTARKFPDA